jgi:hypothetical protein
MGAQHPALGDASVLDNIPQHVADPRSQAIGFSAAATEIHTCLRLQSEAADLIGKIIAVGRIAQPNSPINLIG